MEANHLAYLIIFCFYECVKLIQAPFQCKDSLLGYKDYYFYDHTVVRMSYLYNGNSYTRETACLYQTSPQAWPSLSNCSAEIAICKEPFNRASDWLTESKQCTLFALPYVKHCVINNKYRKV